MSRPSSSHAFSSVAVMLSVPWWWSSHSPNALEGTLTPENSTWPAAAQAGVPPSSTATSLAPSLSSQAASRSARPPPASTQTMRVDRRGSSARARSLAARQRAGRRQEQMRGGEFAFLPRVQQGQFAPVGEPAVQGGGVDADHGL